MVNPVKVIRGEPVVTPLAACQWFDHVVRLALRKIQRVLPTFTSLTARLLSTCVNWPRYSRLVSAVLPAAAGCWLFPAPNGCHRSELVTLPIKRIPCDNW